MALTQSSADIYDFSCNPFPKTSNLLGSFFSLWMKSKITPCVPRGPTIFAKRFIHASPPKVPHHELINASEANLDAPYNEIGRTGP